MNPNGFAWLPLSFIAFSVVIQNWVFSPLWKSVGPRISMPTCNLLKLVLGSSMQCEVFNVRFLALVHPSLSIFIGEGCGGFDAFVLFTALFFLKTGMSRQRFARPILFGGLVFGLFLMYWTNIIRMVLIFLFGVFLARYLPRSEATNTAIHLAHIHIGWLLYLGVGLTYLKVFSQFATTFRNFQWKLARTAAVLCLMLSPSLSYSESCGGPKYLNSNCEMQCSQNTCQDTSFNLDASQFQCCPIHSKTNSVSFLWLVLAAALLFIIVRRNPRGASSLCVGFIATRLVFADGFGNTDYLGQWHTVYRAAAQKSSTDPNVALVGRSWHQQQYKALISSYLTTSGLVDNLFVGNTTSGVVGKQLYDLSGSGLDNLCSALTYAYDGFIVGCRSMKTNGYYDVYLVKLTNYGLLDTSFATSGIKATALGGTTGHAFVRGIVYDAATGNGGENGTVVLTGAIGTYSGGVFHPYVAAFSQKTGAQYGSTTSLAGIDGTGVAIAIDTANSKYYTASTQTVANHSFYVHQFNTSLVAAGGNWGSAVDFTKAIGDAAADSVPSSIMMNGTDVVTLGGNRVDTTAAWRCAMVAHKTADGTLNTTFGKVPAPLASGVDSTGISLYALNTTRDCIINSAVTAPSGTNILPVGTIYNGTNYDFLVTKLSNVGALDTSFSTDGIVIQSSGPGDDVLNSAIYLDGSNTYIYGAGRSHHSSLFNGGALAQVATATGAYTNNVVLKLDAAKSDSQMGYPGSGCLDTTFRDLSSYANNGSFVNFSACGAGSGWNGGGTPANPYRLAFDGSNDGINVGQNSSLKFGSGNYTYSAWIKTTSTGTNRIIIAESDNAVAERSVIKSDTEKALFFCRDSGNDDLVATGTSLISNGNWNMITGIRNGTTGSIYVNGILEASNTDAAVGSCDASGIDVFVGSRAVGTGVDHSGSMSDITFLKTNLTASEVKAKFDAEADRFRATHSGNTVRNGLIYNLDAANASLGTGAFANGCAAGDLSWFDLSSLAYHGTLTSFASCGTSEGWNGDGTTTISGAAGPYRLTFDGSADNVSIPSSVLGAISGDFTVVIWLYPTSLGVAYRTVFDSASRHLSLWIGSGWHGIGGTHAGLTYSVPFTTNEWQQLVMTRSGTAVTVYRNGTVTATATNAGSISAETWILGGNPSGGGSYFVGEMASVLLYSRSLTLAEIRQNCNALKSRFNGATCS